MNYHVLASGSKGNSTYINIDGFGILIDCGITRKQLLYKLSNLGYNEQDIDCVLLTHDHYDHNKNIHIFNKKIVYAGVGCIDDLSSENTVKPYQCIEFDDIKICPLPISHDAHSPMAYVIENSYYKIVYMTDTGYVSQKNIQYIRNADYYIIESNHDIEMLMNSNRPIFLKKRILSDQGHLSNDYSARLMCKVLGDKTKDIVLAHLSQEANTPELALQTYKNIFAYYKVDLTQINLKVADQIEVVSGGITYENQNCKCG